MYIKSKKMGNVLYTKIQTLCKNQDNLRYVFILKKQRNSTLRGFSWNFWSWNLYTKSMRIFVMWRFYIQKVWHLSKSKTICVRFLYTKIWTLCITQFFIGFLKLVEDGGIFMNKKQCTLRQIFYMQKTMQFTLRFIYKNNDTLRHILYAKNNALCATFLYVNFIV